MEQPDGDKDLRKRMKLGFTTMATPELSAEEAINAALRYGYDAVSLRMHEICGEIMLNSSKEELHKIRNLFAQSGIMQGALMCYNTMQNTDKDCYKHTLEYTLKAMENAAEAGAGSIRLFGDAMHMDTFCEAVCTAMEKSQTDVRILLQNHVGNADCHDIINKFCKIENTGLIFSPDHIVQEKAYHICKESLPFIREVYAANKVTPDNYVRYVPLADGDYDWKILYKILCDGGFNGILYIKWERIWHSELADYNYILPREKRFFDFLNNQEGMS